VGVPMPDQLHYFESPAGINALALPFDYHQSIKDWTSLRKRMVRQVPPEFTRDEWAYLATFLDRENLFNPFLTAFGTEVAEPDQTPNLLYRPRGPIAVWLPNNVSLLGPLTLILLSLTGQSIRLKLGSSAQDLTGAFLQYAVANLPQGEFKEYLTTKVAAEIFSREDPRQQELTKDAQVRIIFGSDAAAEAIHQLPHPLESLGFSFVDRESVAWLEQGALNEQVLTTLIKVFAIYGQAGCTSPKRVILLDGSNTGVQRLRDDLLDLWPTVIAEETPMHTASANVMAEQWARALGWDARRTPRNAALLVHGARDLPGFDALMTLCIQGATRNQALADLPLNIQTIGHALESPTDPAWLKLLAGSRVRRFVDLSRMHHFGSIWDGQEFWRQCFEPMEVRL
jgi:hypothetical protein